METIPFSYAYAYVYVAPGLHSGPMFMHVFMFLCLCLCPSVNQAFMFQRVFAWSVFFLFFLFFDVILGYNLKAQRVRLNTVVANLQSKVALRYI